MGCSLDRHRCPHERVGVTVIRELTWLFEGMREHRAGRQGSRAPDAPVRGARMHVIRGRFAIHPGDRGSGLHAYRCRHKGELAHGNERSRRADDRRIDRDLALCGGNRPCPVRALGEAGRCNRRSRNRDRQTRVPRPLPPDRRPYHARLPFTPHWHSAAVLHRSSYVREPAQQQSAAQSRDWARHSWQHPIASPVGELRQETVVDEAEVTIANDSRRRMANVRRIAGSGKGRNVLEARRAAAGLVPNWVRDR